VLSAEQAWTHNLWITAIIHERAPSAFSATANVTPPCPSPARAGSPRRCERANLDGDSLVARDFGHSRIWLNRKNIDSPREELLGSDPGACANIECRLRALSQKVIDELGGVARPARIVDSRGGTK
jgi:hypothetical protein